MKNKRVLIVDDDPVVGRATLRILKRHAPNAEIDLVTRPQLALDWITNDPGTDWFVVTDKDMKSAPQASDTVADGVDLANSLRALTPRISVYIVLTTGNTGYVQMANAQGHPFDAILVKPYNVPDLTKYYDAFV